MLSQLQAVTCKMEAQMHTCRHSLPKGLQVLVLVSSGPGRLWQRLPLLFTPCGGDQSMANA